MDQAKEEGLKLHASSDDDDDDFLSSLTTTEPAQPTPARRGRKPKDKIAVSTRTSGRLRGASPETEPEPVTPREVPERQRLGLRGRGPAKDAGSVSTMPLHTDHLKTSSARVQDKSSKASSPARDHQTIKTRTVPNRSNSSPVPSPSTTSPSGGKHHCTAEVEQSSKAEIEEAQNERRLSESSLECSCLVDHQTKDEDSKDQGAMSPPSTTSRSPRKRQSADGEVLRGLVEDSPSAKVLRKLPGRLVTVVEEKEPRRRRRRTSGTVAGGSLEETVEENTSGFVSEPNKDNTSPSPDSKIKGMISKSPQDQDSTPSPCVPPQPVRGYPPYSPPHLSPDMPVLRNLPVRRRLETESRLAAQMGEHLLGRGRGWSQSKKPDTPPGKDTGSASTESNVNSLVPPLKRKRGRPPKTPPRLPEPDKTIRPSTHLASLSEEGNPPLSPKRKRGRPRKDSTIIADTASKGQNSKKETIRSEVPVLSKPDSTEPAATTQRKLETSAVVNTSGDTQPATAEETDTKNEVSAPAAVSTTETVQASAPVQAPSVPAPLVMAPFPEAAQVSSLAPVSDISSTQVSSASSSDGVPATVAPTTTAPLPSVNTVSSTLPVSTAPAEPSTTEKTTGPDSATIVATSVALTPTISSSMAVKVAPLSVCATTTATCTEVKTINITKATEKLVTTTTASVELPQASTSTSDALTSSLSSSASTSTSDALTSTLSNSASTSTPSSSTAVKMTPITVQAQPSNSETAMTPVKTIQSSSSNSATTMSVKTVQTSSSTVLTRTPTTTLATSLPLTAASTSSLNPEAAMSTVTTTKVPTKSASSSEPPSAPFCSATATMSPSVSVTTDVSSSAPAENLGVTSSVAACKKHASTFTTHITPKEKGVNIPSPPTAHTDVTSAPITLTIAAPEKVNTDATTNIQVSTTTAARTKTLATTPETSATSHQIQSSTLEGSTTAQMEVVPQNPSTFSSEKQAKSRSDIEIVTEIEAVETEMRTSKEDDKKEDSYKYQSKRGKIESLCETKMEEATTTLKEESKQKLVEEMDEDQKLPQIKRPLSRQSSQESACSSSPSSGCSTSTLTRHAHHKRTYENRHPTKRRCMDVTSEAGQEETNQESGEKNERGNKDELSASTSRKRHCRSSSSSSDSDNSEGGKEHRLTRSAKRRLQDQEKERDKKRTGKKPLQSSDKSTSNNANASTGGESGSDTSSIRITRKSAGPQPSQDSKTQTNSAPLLPPETEVLGKRCSALNAAAKLLAMKGRVDTPGHTTRKDPGAKASGTTPAASSEKNQKPKIKSIPPSPQSNSLTNNKSSGSKTSTLSQPSRSASRSTRQCPGSLVSPLEMESKRSKAEEKETESRKSTRGKEGEPSSRGHSACSSMSSDGEGVEHSSRSRSSSNSSQRTHSISSQNTEHRGSRATSSGSERDRSSERVRSRDNKEKQDQQRESRKDSRRSQKLSQEVTTSSGTEGTPDRVLRSVAALAAVQARSPAASTRSSSSQQRHNKT